MITLDPGERKILQALRVCQGWLPRNALRWTAQYDRRPRGEMSAALASLAARGSIEVKEVDHIVGKTGRGATLYRILGPGEKELEGS